MPTARTLVIALALRLLAAGQTVPTPTDTVPYYVRDVYLTEAEFTEGKVTRLCRDILKDQRAGYVSVWFFTSEAAAIDYRNGKLSDHISYEMWRGAYDRLKDLGPVARMVTIGDSSVLLFRAADGSVTRAVLAGGNPLDIRIAGGKEAHILDLVFSLQNSQSKEYRILVYAWTPETLTAELGQQVIANLKPKLPFPDVDLFVRNDPWFIDEPFFPAAPPFNPDFAPPAKAQYAVSPTLVCVKLVNADQYNCGISTRHN